MASSATDSGNKDKPIREALVKTGHVDVMISVGNNFFYTKSLPCSLWFFDKGKPEHLKNTVLFIDARNYYTAVDRTLNEWSPWQLKNLNAIVWLYRGQKDKYTGLLEKYHASILEGVERIIKQGKNLVTWLPAEYTEKLKASVAGLERQKNSVSYTDIQTAIDILKEEADDAEDKTIKFADRADREVRNKLAADFGYKTYREYEKQIELETGWVANFAEEVKKIIAEALWLSEKFGDGAWNAIPGLCKAATLEEIEAHGYSLTPGAYVGVAAQETDDVDFSARMKEIHEEMKRLQAESNELMDTISRNWEEMGL